MPQLTNTQSSLILSVAKGNSLIVRNRSGVETVTGSSVPREDATAVLGSGTYVYGPQTSASTLTISTTGVCDYDIVAGDPTPATEPARVVRSAATGAPASLIDPATGQPVGGGVVAEYTICPSDNAAASYDLKLTGTNDDQAITAFLQTLVVSASDSKPALIRFLSGNYNLTSEIVINNNWITFAGPNRPFWRRFGGAYGSGTMSIPGSRGGAIFNQATNGKGVFTFGSNFLTGDEGIPRWRGIEFRDLMFNGVIGGVASTGTAIVDTSGATDRVRVNQCLFMGFASGIQAAWDSPVITFNDFQSLGTGYGVWIKVGSPQGALADVSHNIFFDAGCVGVRVDPDGSKVVGNVFGNLAKDCVQIGGKWCVVAANTVRNTYAGFCTVYNYTGGAPAGVSITGNAVCLVDYGNRLTAPFSTNNSNAVTIGGAGAVNDIAGCVVDGNTFTRFGTTTGAAVVINSGSGTLPTGVRANVVGINGYEGNLGGGTGWNAGNANPNSLPTGTVIASTTTV